MDGVHDLGGREGFGAIETKHDEEAFHSDWEARAYGMVQCARNGKGWTIDWFRFCRELIPPTDYLTRPYFDQWMTTLTAQMVDEGYVTLEEIKAGRSDFIPKADNPPGTAQAARDFVKYPKSFALETPAPPLFAASEPVRAAAWGHSGHTRLPGYARGRSGTIHAHHGSHILADASARGVEKGEHLYTVRFASSELWPEAQAPGHQVFIDLWESYLEPA